MLERVQELPFFCFGGCASFVHGVEKILVISYLRLQFDVNNGFQNVLQRDNVAASVCQILILIKRVDLNCHSARNRALPGLLLSVFCARLCQT